MEWNLKVSHSFEYFQHLQKCGNCTKLVGGFTYFFFSPRKLGKMNPIWLIFLKMGWFNHQLANLHFLTFFCGEKHRCLRIHPPLKRWRWEVMMWPTQHFSDPWEIPILTVFTSYDFGHSCFVKHFFFTTIVEPLCQMWLNTTSSPSYVVFILGCLWTKCWNNDVSWFPCMICRLLIVSCFQKVWSHTLLKNKHIHT